MRKIVVIILVIGIGCSEPRTSLDNLFLKGEIIKLTEEHFNVIENGGKYQPGEKLDWNSTQLFNEVGQIIRTEYYSSKGALDGTDEFTYDNNQFLIAQSYLSRGIKLLYSYKYENDLDGNQIKTIRYNDSSKVTSTSTLKYSGRNVKSGESLEGKIKGSWINDYQGDKIVRQDIFDSAENKINTVRWKYNSYGFVAKYSVYNRKDSLTYDETYDYPKYDSKNNWVERITFKSGKPVNLTIRKILYKEDTFIDSKSIIGIWRQTKRNNWIEFKDDGQYHSGYDENISDIGKWELDNKNKTLTFESNKPGDSKKYTFLFDGEHLIFLTLDGQEEKRFKRR